MSCDRNCENCPFFSGIFPGDEKCIRVQLVGAQIHLNGRRSSLPKALRFRDYTIRFLDITGDDYHIGRKVLSTKPDIILNIVDSMNLEDSMRLTTRLIDMDSSVIVAFGRYEELLKTGHSLDLKTLGELLGLPVTALEKPGEEEFSRLLGLITDTYEHPTKRHRHVHYGQDIDESIDEITKVIATSPSLASIYHDRYLAVRLLEDPEYILSDIKTDPMAEQIARTAAKAAVELGKELGDTPERLIRKARHGFIHGALQETLRHSADDSAHSFAEKLDTLLTSRILGFPILILILLGVFEATFTIGAYPEKWIEAGITLLGNYLETAMPAGWFSNLLANGIVQGVGAVIAFLPNIIILFFFLSLLEDSGYMARAAFLMDKVMHRIGLHGRSFIPMLIGFGCNVPAIMAARSIEDRKDRTLTMLMIPFMSCSARLPVYLLFVSAFFSDHKAVVMISIYLTGILLSILFAFLMKRTRFFRKEEEDYVSELPPFRKPTVRNTGAHIWERTRDYLRKITTVILAASVVIWALEYFPADNTNFGENKEESYLADIGKAAEPVMALLGFDWKMNVCLITGLPAKEAIVSTMGILYHSEDDTSLVEAMRGGGTTVPAALAFMVFVLLYFPCIATINALRSEAGGKWAAFTVLHSLIVAWLMAFLIFQIGSEAMTKVTMGGAGANEVSRVLEESS